jgi:hypothetical protein
LDLSILDNIANDLIKISRHAFTIKELTEKVNEILKILRFDFIKAGIKFGDKKILTYHFDQKNFENNYAFHLAAFTNKEDPLLENIPTSKSEIKYYEKYWSVGIGASIGGNTSGIYNIVEDPEGNISRSFDYSDRLSKTTPVKNINYTLNGHLEFSDPEFEQVTNVQLTGFASAEPLNSLHAFETQRHQPLRINQESPPFFSQRYLISATVQKAHTQFLLQIMNLTRERRLRDAQFFSCPGEA